MMGAVTYVHTSTPSLSLSSTRMLLLSLWLLAEIIPVRAEFNYEVKKRVEDRIQGFMDGPVATNGLTSKYRHFGGFPHNMDARDRDNYLTYSYTYMQQFTFDMVYYGLEDGLFLGYGRNWGTYREPANSYNVANITLENKKYFYGCFNRETGEEETCTMAAGGKYIKCIDDCKLAVCPDAESQRCYKYEQNGSNNDDSMRHHACQPDSVKWCPQYDVLEHHQEQQQEETALGYAPRYYHCHDEQGKFTQQIGGVVKKDGITLGNCYYGDGTTLVNHTEFDEYEYCNGKPCNALVGAYRSRDYDPRFRNWYIITREVQEPNWSPPYPFFSNLELGITHSQPIYSWDEQSNRKTFAGVVAVDYTFEYISNFLQTSYSNSSISVVVFEKEDPNYIVASSTGMQLAKHVLKDDSTQPCPDVSSANNAKLCSVIRYEMSNLEEGNPMDNLLSRAYQIEKDKGYPDELLIVKEEDVIGSNVYVSQSTEFQDGNLEWIILVLLPAEDNGESYSLTVDDQLFAWVCFISITGFCLCLIMFILFVRKRARRAVAIRDWRFTSAFIMGCAILNISSLTLLGPNTNALCMTRMWTFHIFFVVAISPLFVKIWRIYKLTDSSRGIRRHSVSNRKATIYTMPIILIQVLILLCFSIFDPPRQEEFITISDGIVTQEIICAQEYSLAFMIVEVCFEANLVLIGCVLAYLTRNLNEDFSEARQLMFSMYNIAFIGITTSIGVFVMNIGAAEEITSMAMAVFWGTVFSSAAFVVPILLQVKRESNRQSIRVSGIDSGLFRTIENAPDNGKLSASFRLKKLKNNELCIVPEDTHIIEGNE